TYRRQLPRRQWQVNDSRSRYASAGCTRSGGRAVFQQCPRQVPTRRGGGATGRVTTLAGAGIFLILTGVFEGAGGAALVLGVYARVAAVAVAVFTVFVSLVFVRFWSFEGPPEMRTMLKNIFVGNFALTGGLVYIA